MTTTRSGGRATGAVSSSGRPTTRAEALRPGSLHRREAAGLLRSVVIDEAHEMKAGARAAGIAAGAFSRPSPHAWADGHASGGLRATYTFCCNASPSEHYGYHDEQRFVALRHPRAHHPGGRDGEDGRVSRRKKPPPSENAPDSPRRCYTTFCSTLSSIDRCCHGYPRIEEIEIYMEEDQRAVHLAFKEDLAAELQRHWRGSKARAYLQSLLHHPGTLA